MHDYVIDTVAPAELGHRLRLARNARGLTQQDAADWLNVARTTITALEKGDRKARPGEIISLADLYGRPVSHFVGSRPWVADFQVQFRSALKSAVGVKEQGELRESIDIFQQLSEDYLHLENLAGIPARHTPPPEYSIGMVNPETAAADVASSERNRLGLGDGPIHNLREVLEDDVGVRVFNAKLPSRVSGMFAYSEEFGGSIVVNSTHPAERQRWSLAHEYGHFLTRRFNPAISTIGRYRRVPASEQFANAFAQNFLMPSAGLQRKFNNLSRAVDGKVTAADICRFAHGYFVSVEAMMMRLEGLRLLPFGTWEKLLVRGFEVRKAQAALDLARPRSAKPSMPFRFQLLAVQAYLRADLSEGELAKLMRVDRVTARQVVHEITSTHQFLDEGEVQSLSIDLASLIAD